MKGKAASDLSLRHCIGLFDCVATVGQEFVVQTDVPSRAVPDHRRGELRRGVQSVPGDVAAGWDTHACTIEAQTLSYIEGGVNPAAKVMSFGVLSSRDQVERFVAAACNRPTSMLLLLNEVQPRR
jgi:hypothetical protein